MRDDTAFLEWCVRVGFFSEFDFSPVNDPDLRAAVLAMFFAGNNSDYKQFNTQIVSLSCKKKSGNKTDLLRVLLDEPEAVFVKAAFISTPWQKKRLNSRSIAFAAARQGLKDTERLAFDTWMEKSYSRFRTSVSAPLFAMSLGTAVCPYCDKAFLDVGKQLYGELDHYLDKSTYSYYALNLYNFVPVCGICNRKKSKTRLRHFNPLNDSLDSVFNFKLSPKDQHDALVHYQTANVKIQLNFMSGKDKHLDELKDVFSLDDRYENMTAVVSYLAQLKRIYTPEWMEELKKNYGVDYSPAQLKQLLLGQFSFRNPDVRLQPLTKLIDDLVKDLDVFNENTSGK